MQKKKLKQTKTSALYSPNSIKAIRMKRRRLFGKICRADGF